MTFQPSSISWSFLFFFSFFLSCSLRLLDSERLNNVPRLTDLIRVPLMFGPSFVWPHVPYTFHCVWKFLRSLLKVSVRDDSSFSRKDKHFSPKESGEVAGQAGAATEG